MKTGRDANRSGIYVSECCLKEVVLAESQMCPRCPRCSALTVWEFVKQDLRPRPVVSEIEEFPILRG
jgi:hypothetical protein